MDKAIFKKRVGATMKAAGFVGKGQSWFKEGSDAVVSLSLQKSDFDEKYYVNFGVWLKELGSTAFPAPNHCHIQIRLTSLFPAATEMIEKACRLSSSVEEVDEFVAFLSAQVAPFCETCLTLEGLRALQQSGAFVRSLTIKEAKALLAQA